MSNLPFAQLEAFLAVARSQSFSAAARELGVSRSAVSQSLRRLEDVCAVWAEQGLGLAYAMEPLVDEQLRKGSLRRVLEPYAPSVPGFYLYYPSRAQRSAPLGLFVETLQELSARRRAKREVETKAKARLSAQRMVGSRGPAVMACARPCSASAARSRGTADR